MRMFLKTLLCSTALFSAIAPKPALAHPHEFVTMLTTALFNEKGAVTGLRYQWTFDEFFTAYAIEGQDANKNGKAEQNELDALLSEIMGNIKSINYFTKFDANHPAPTFAGHKEIAASMEGRQLRLNFELSFTKPYSLNKNPLNYSVYDDEFYIAMQHEDGDNSYQPANAPGGCRTELIPPDPSDEISEFASSLGKSESGGTDLGKNFAEWISITCGEAKS